MIVSCRHFCHMRVALYLSSLSFERWTPDAMGGVESHYRLMPYTRAAVIAISLSLPSLWTQKQRKE